MLVLSLNGVKSLINKNNAPLRKDVLDILNDTKVSKDSIYTVNVGGYEKIVTMVITGDKYNGNLKSLKELYFDKWLKDDKMKCFGCKVWNSVPNRVTGTFGGNPSKWEFGLGKSKDEVKYYR